MRVAEWMPDGKDDWHMTGSGSEVSWFWSEKSPPVSITEGMHTVTLHGSDDAIKIRALRFDTNQTEAGCYWQVA